VELLPGYVRCRQQVSVASWTDWLHFIYKRCDPAVVCAFCFMHIFTRAMQCCSVVLAMPLSVRVSVCYKSVLCPNGGTDRAAFWHRGYRWQQTDCQSLWIIGTPRIVCGAGST